MKFAWRVFTGKDARHTLARAFAGRTRAFDLGRRATSGGGEERQERQLRQISRSICDVIMTEFPGIFSGVM